MCFDVNPLAHEMYLRNLTRDPRAGYDHAAGTQTGWRAERLRGLMEGARRVRRRGGMWTPATATRA